MISNKSLVFKAVPLATPVVGEHFVVEELSFDIEAGPVANCITVKVYYVSYDPCQRGCMRTPDKASYAPPYVAGYPIVNGAVAKVLKSAHAEFQPGDVVWGILGAQDYMAVPPMLMPTVRKLFNPAGLDWKLFTGVLGTSGISAYASLFEYCPPKSGQTIFITGAAGAVGSIAGQLCKTAGMTVIGSVGSDEKLDYILNELKFDAGFNYKTEKPMDALKRLAPDGIDVFYDNVGGEHFDAALVTLRDHGHIISCGMISQYNLPQPEKYGIQYGMEIFLKRLTINGFIITDLAEKWAPDFGEKMYGYLLSGDIKSKESVTFGIENAAEGFLAMFNGSNFGKSLLEIADLNKETQT